MSSLRVWQVLVRAGLGFSGQPATLTAAVSCYWETGRVGLSINLLLYMDKGDGGQGMNTMSNIRMAFL